MSQQTQCVEAAQRFAESVTSAMILCVFWRYKHEAWRAMKRTMVVLLLVLLVACGGALATSPPNTSGSPTALSQIDQQRLDDFATRDAEIETDRATRQAMEDSRYDLDSLIALGDVLQEQFAMCVDPSLRGGAYPRATATSIAIGCATVTANYRGPIMATARAAGTALANLPPP